MIRVRRTCLWMLLVSFAIRPGRSRSLSESLVSCPLRCLPAVLMVVLEPPDGDRKTEALFTKKCKLLFLAIH